MGFDPRKSQEMEYWRVDIPRLRGRAKMLREVQMSDINFVRGVVRGRKRESKEDDNAAAVLANLGGVRLSKSGGTAIFERPKGSAPKLRGAVKIGGAIAAKTFIAGDPDFA